MYGRYGADPLYKALFAVALIVMIINLFIQSIAINVLVLLLLVLVYYRVFSKNIYKRQIENSYYLKMVEVVRKELKLNIRRIKEVRSYRFRKCPNCRQVLRLKRKKGNHKVLCPKCKTEFNVKFIV